jgi:hypothetical protein
MSDSNATAQLRQMLREAQSRQEEAEMREQVSRGQVEAQSILLADAQNLQQVAELDIMAIREEKDEAQQQYDNALKEIDELKKTHQLVVDELQQENQHAETQIGNLNQDNQHIRDQSMRASDANAQLVAETHELKEQLSDQKTQLMVLEQQLAIQQQQTRDKEQQQRSAMQRSAGLEQQLARERAAKASAPPQARNPQDAGVAAALAQRLELLLAENERMREKVKFLEESVQLLSTDLENKRMLLQEFRSTTTTSSEITSAALSKAAASSSSETMETFLEKTLSENIQLKKEMEVQCGYSTL